jgi:hypothetical protein
MIKARSREQSRLDHLIDGAILLREKSLTESIGKIVNDLCLAVGLELAVIAVRRNKPQRIFHGWARIYDLYDL